MDIWRQAAHILSSPSSLTLMVVCDSEGSAPGKQGFIMLVSAAGELVGTIGGGIMERRLVDQARSMASEQAAGAILIQQDHREKAPIEHRSGMICAGSQKIILTVLRPQQLAEVEQMIALEEQGLGGYQIDHNGWRLMAHLGPEDPSCQLDEEGQSWRWTQKTGARATVYVIGGGHVGHALCKVLALTDFYVVNLDHRAEAVSFQNNTQAHKKICCPVEEIGDHLHNTRHGYAVVVTTAYVTDKAALEVLASKNLRYVGLMGSLAKIHKIFRELEDIGIKQEWLRTVHAPIGIAIKNRTPIEIAISIAAQLIDLRNTTAQEP